MQARNSSSTTRYCEFVLRQTLSISFATLSNARPHEMRKWLMKLELAISREGNRGRLKHYKYDLDRHIALKSVRGRINQMLKEKSKTKTKFLSS